MSKIDLFEAIYSARAQRRLKPDPVSDEIIERILDAAIRAPSPNNTQMWRFIVVKDPEIRRRLASIYSKAGHSVDVAFSQMLSNSEVAVPIDQSSAKIMSSAKYLWDHMHEPPVLLVACLNPSPPPWEMPGLAPETAKGMKALSPRMDGSGIYPAIQNIILACRALGLGTVMTTMHAIFEDEFRSVLGIPAEVTTWAMLPIGYPMGKFGSLKRNPASEVTFRDGWGNPWKV
jgi:nitroreductase